MVEIKTFSRTFDAINHRISDPKLVSPTTVTATAFMEGGIGHDMRILGDFRIKAGEIIGKITGIYVSWLGYPTYSISGISVDAAGYFEVAEAAIYGGDTVLQFFAAQGAFGSGTPGEQILGTKGDDIGTGSLGDDLYRGRGGADEFNGSLGDDEIFGQSGRDNLSGGSGFDLIRGGSGSDFIYGNENDDRLFGEAGSDLIDGGSGDDIAFGGGGGDTIYGNFGHDRLLGGGRGDWIEGGEGNDVIKGQAGNDVLAGDAGNDRVLGGDGNDTISGGIGTDTLLGESGRDRIDGGAGDDLIDGGRDNDRLSGGSGEDVFQFRSPENGEQDVITDYDIIQDRILLSKGAGSYSLSTSGNGDAALEHDGRTIVFLGVTLNELKASLATFDPFDL